MAEFISHVCLSCGKELKINSNFNRFVCGYCGCEQLVKREHGNTSLVPVVKASKTSRDGQCHICGRDGRYGWDLSLDSDSSLPETHRCQICYAWVCVDCLSTTDGGWVCKRCKP